MASGRRRRYSDAEMRRILARASATDAEARHGGSSSEGHTLADIRDVAREAGIDPATVDRAAAALEKPAATHVFLGFPLTLEKEDLVPHRLSREQMLLITRAANRTLGVSGSVTEGEGWIEWYNEQKRTFVGMVRTSGGTRVRVISDQARAFTWGIGTIGIVGVFLTLNVLMNAGGTGDLLIGTGIAAGTYGGMRLYWSQRCRSALTRIEQILDAVHAQVRPEPGHLNEASPAVAPHPAQENP